MEREAFALTEVEEEEAVEGDDAESDSASRTVVGSVQGSRERTWLNEDNLNGRGGEHSEGGLAEFTREGILKLIDSKAA